MLVEKKVEEGASESKKWRKRYRLVLAVNKDMNRSLQATPFKMESAKMAGLLIEEGDELAKGDLESGYFHISIHPAARRWVRFQWDGQVYQYAVLFFGLSTAPYVFSMAMQAVSDAIPGRHSFYIDDWLFIARRGSLKAVLADVVWPLTEALGFFWEDEKSEWAPSHLQVHLGFQLDAKALCWRMTAKQRRRIRERCRYLGERGYCKVRTLQSFLGLLQSQALAWDQARLAAWLVGNRLWDWMGSLLGPGETGPRASGRMMKKAAEVWWELSDLECRTLAWILQRLGTSKEVSWRTVPDLQDIISDAGVFWAARWGDRWARGEFPAELPHTPEFQVWRETWALWAALASWRKDLSGCTVRLISDNQALVFSVRFQRNTQLMRMVSELLLDCARWDIRIHSSLWISTEEMVQVGVDGLSRVVDSGDWCTSDRTWARLTAWVPGLLSERAVDRFASKGNSRCSQFNSRFAEPDSMGVDALAQNWGGWLNFACPPLPIVSETVELILRQRAESVIIIPRWPLRPWFKVLNRLAGREDVVVSWLQLGRGSDSLAPGVSSPIPVGKVDWEFLAVRLHWLGQQSS
jgi:hypothetical protein